MGKLVSQEEIIKIVRAGQSNGKTFVATNGCFDILHVGHVRYLQKTKECADFSIIMLNSDKSVKMLKICFSFGGFTPLYQVLLFALFSFVR